jgi:RimJ/RimL family protein N-acetyltransferase
VSACLAWCLSSKHRDTGEVPIIVLETPRLIMRQFTGDDVDNLFDLNSDPQVMRYLTGGRPTPREAIRDEIIPFHLGVYERFDRLGTWAARTLTVNAASRRVLENCGLALVRTTPYEGPGTVEGAEHGEVEYALTKPEWQART